MSEGRQYQELKPATELVSPNKSSGPKTNVGWAYCACTSDRHLFLLYFERDCPKAVLSGAASGAEYKAQWFDPRQGKWLASEPGTVTANSEGVITLPAFPDGKVKSGDDWALKLVAGHSRR